MNVVSHEDFDEKPKELLATEFSHPNIIHYKKYDYQYTPAHVEVKARVDNLKYLFCNLGGDADDIFNDVCTSVEFFSMFLEI